MDIDCPKCHRTFHTNQEYAYHAGFGNVGFLYCDSCPNLVVFGSFDPDYRKIVGRKVHPWVLGPFKRWRVERRLKPCSCGGHFRFGAKPRCPLCNQAIPSILPDAIHFIETGKRFDGDTEAIWKS
jgi:hypothetical protein